MERICELNGISSRTNLRIGQKLIVRYSESAPTKVASTQKTSSSSSGNRKIVYQVKRGDTLFQIASDHKTDVNSLKKWNNLSSQQIHPGDHLTIYTK